MPDEATLNNGVLKWRVWSSAGEIYAEAYYDNTGPRDPSQPIVERSGLIENGQTRDRALRVWNTSNRAQPVELTDQTTGLRVTVRVPGGGDLVRPADTRTAAQLAGWGFATRGDLATISIGID